jgi:hypothetical protein
VERRAGVGPPVEPRSAPRPRAASRLSPGARPLLPRH